MIEKIINLFWSYAILIKYKLIYGKRFSFDWSVRVKRTLKIRISKDGKILLKSNVIIRDFVVLNVSDKGKIELEEGVFLNDFVCLNSRDKIWIGKNTIIGQGTKFYDHDHDYKSNQMNTKFLVHPVIIEEAVWIGADCDILKGTYISANSVIGANSIIKQKIEANTLFINTRHNNTRKIL